MNLSNKTLFIILVVVGGIYFATRFMGKSEARSFRSEVVTVDTAAVSTIRIFPQGDAEGYQLQREAGGWQLVQGDFRVPATASALTGILASLSQIKVQRLVARSEDKWADYEVDAAKGTRVEVAGNSGNLTEFVVGRFNFNPNTRTATSYIRRSDETDVYAVDGLLSMSFSQGPDSYRNRQLIQLPQENLTNLTYRRNGESIAMSYRAGQLFRSTGEALDSTETASYLRTLLSLNGSNFINSFSPTGQSPTHSLVLQSAAGEAITLNGYANPAGNPAFVMHSSQNPVSYFTSDSTTIFQNAFGKLEELLGSGD